MLTDEFLSQLQKPARYIGNEWNAVKKDFESAFIKVALCFPDVYEVGMSNFGIRIIYGVLNEMDDVVCERVFHPAGDAEELMRKSAIPLFSLESHKPLKSFDILAFSLGYELGYTNVLNILDMSGIPKYSSQRGEEFPLVIAGGSCVLNPEPMADFIDLFVIGEGDEAIKEIADTFRRLKSSEPSVSRKELLRKLALIDGVYVPCFYKAEYNDDGTIKSFTPDEPGIPRIIKKRFVRDLDSAHYPLNWPMPYIQIIHDRVFLEIARGCPNRCRFCQARVFYYPYRQRSARALMDLSKKAFCATGYDEISLLGLSVTDYSGIQEFLKELINTFRDKGVSVSLPSIKARDITGDLLSLITKIKKSGLTLAPEAGTQRLRELIGKDLSLDEFFASVLHAYKLGYKHIKLYFMIGLPGETQEDLDGIAALARQVSELKRQVEKGAAQVNISVATFIPKPHTAFQWLAMDSAESIDSKQRYLCAKIKALGPKFKINFHNRQMSFIEGAMSRGDRRLAQVIFSAWQKGSKFDAWSDSFINDNWLEAFSKSNIDPYFYACRERARDEHLPWDFIDTGIDKTVLLSESEKALT